MMGRLGVSGFTTASRHARSHTLTCSSCRRLRSSAKRSQDGTPRGVRFYDGYAAERSLRSSSAATRHARSHTLICSSCRRRRSSAQRSQDGTTRCVRFYDGFVPRQRLHLTRSSCRRLRSSAQRSQDGTLRCVRFYDGFAADRSLRSSSAATGAALRSEWRSCSD